MPRISRSQTLFEVNGQPYSIRIAHEHYDPPKTVQGKYKPLKVIHKTIATLRTPTGEERKGETLCSLQEVRYNWKRGIKIAVERALEDFGLTTAKSRGPFLGAFYRENSKKEYHRETSPVV